MSVSGELGENYCAPTRRFAARLGSAAASLLLWLLVALGLVTLVLGILARPAKDGISRLFGHPVLTVLSGSMSPTFRPGDLVVDDPLGPAKAGRLAAGDVITFHVSGSSKELITHRIAGVRALPDGQVAYQTKGDANNAPDEELVAPSQVVGTYTRRVPFAGYALEAIRTKAVFFGVVLLPLLYIGAGALFKRRRPTEQPVEAPVAAESPDPAEVVPIGAAQH